LKRAKSTKRNITFTLSAAATFLAVDLRQLNIDLFYKERKIRKKYEKRQKNPEAALSNAQVLDQLDQAGPIWTIWTGAP